MLTISGLGLDYEVSREPDAPSIKYRGSYTSSYAPTTEVPTTLVTAAPQPGRCVAPDVMSEFGCLTPVVASGVCPPNSQPYNINYCLRIGDVVAEAAAAAKTAAEAAAQAQAAADAAAAVAAAQQTSLVAQAAAEAEALRQQQYADMAARAAQQAADAAAAMQQPQSQGTEPSPGMQIIDTESGRPIIDLPVMLPPALKKTPWALIGAGVGIGLLAAFLVRR